MSLTEAQLDAIVTVGDHLTLTEPDKLRGRVYGRRSCKVAWLNKDRVGGYGLWRDVAAIMNVKEERLVEDFQYVTYDQVGDHFDWHRDDRRGTNRRLTMVMQLSHPDEYEGCVLQLETRAGPISIIKTRGSSVVFGAGTLHRVTPLLSGVRRALVVWAT